MALTSTATEAVQALINEAVELADDCRFRQALTAASRAVAAAETLDDPVLLVRALLAEERPLRLTGELTAAMARVARVLTLAEDPAFRHRLADSESLNMVARAHFYLAESARWTATIPLRDVLDILDHAERWLRSIGHWDWRSALLSQRSFIYSRLDETDTAIALAEEALSAYSPDAPGFDRHTYVLNLGDVLQAANRSSEARRHYNAVLDDPRCDDWDRMRAFRGLTHCAVADGQAAEAVRYAQGAMRAGELIGGDEVCAVLSAKVAACRAAGDLETAFAAATRELDIAQRNDYRFRLYGATLDVVDVALDRGDRATVEAYLPDLDAYGAATDASRGRTICAGEIAERRERLTNLGG